MKARDIPLRLAPKLKAILAQEYPRFSNAEYARRHATLANVMRETGVDSLLVVTESRVGNATQWVSGWPGTAEALTVFRPGEKMWMSVEWVNHTELARYMCPHMDVVWGEHRGLEKAAAELKRRGAKRVGVMGPLRVAKWHSLEKDFELVSLDAKYARLRVIKSAEELDWLTIGAALSDAGLAALMAGTKPGVTERELSAACESGYTKHGGTTMIHYLGVTPMKNPSLCVPRQHPSPRKVKKGDVVFCEISAFWWDYAGQVLRTYTVGANATPLYRDLHATAEAAFDAVTKTMRHGTTMQEIIEATGIIEKNGFTICDDLVHGFGGGYFQPIIGTKSRMAGKLPDMVLEENMTVVVQPNVITTDRKAGVQVGEMIRVTRNGWERMHKAKRGLLRVA